MKFKRIELAVVGLLTFMFVYAANVSMEQQRLADGLLRLHVIANSDSVRDQQIKLMVRDRVLEVTEPLLRSANSQAEVRARLRSHLQQITNQANAVLTAQNMPYQLTAQLAGEYYPTRRYDTFALPAGQYTGLKIRLGQAQGKNWWCVVFPPLCTQAAQAPQNDLCRHTTFRFKIAETIGKLRNQG